MRAGLGTVGGYQPTAPKADDTEGHEPESSSDVETVAPSTSDPLTGRWIGLSGVAGSGAKSRVGDVTAALSRRRRRVRRRVAMLLIERHTPEGAQR